MSTINSAVFVDSDDEYDPDFVPDDHLDSSDEVAPRTVTRPEPAPADAEAQKATKEKARESLWESFQTSVAAAIGSSSASTSKQIKLVKVERKYRFAGEEVSEVIEVPEDSEDAKKWPVWIPQSSRAESVPTSHGLDTVDETTTTQSEMANISQRAKVATASSSSSPPPLEIGAVSKSQASSAVKASTRQKPGPRKPKTVLAPLSSGKPKKITTLEKSAMDWRAHITQSGSTAEESTGGESIADELERNRRGGGYLEKVAFLDRVGNRREELFEDSRKRRRKG